MRIVVAYAMGCLVLITGCGKGESIAKKAGATVGETVTDFASGVGKGIDIKMTVPVELSEDLAKYGLSKTVSKETTLEPGREKGIAIYFISKTLLKGVLIMKALNKEGLEIGRSTVDIDFAADDAKYVTFKFDKELDSRLVEKYSVDIKNAPAERAQ